VTPTIEDRLRAHFADPAARPPVPGPESDVALRRVQEDSDPAGATRLPLGRRRAPWRLVVAVAAVAATIAAVALVAPRLHENSSTVIGGHPSTTDATTTTTTAPAPAAPAPTTVPTTTAPPPAGSTPTGPIVGPLGVLGWWDGRAWVNARGTTEVPASGGEAYQLVRLGEPIVRAVGSAPEPSHCLPPGGWRIAADPEVDESQETLHVWRIAVAGVADLRPRPVELLDPGGDAYRQAVRDVLSGLGIDDPDPDVVQVVRADLDGDGAAEVFVVAEHLADPQTLLAEPGDYSLILLQRAGDGGVVTTIFDQSIADAASQFLDVARLSAVADLNGDGRMEVVVDSYTAGNRSTAAFEMGADGGLRQVLAVGCGD